MHIDDTHLHDIGSLSMQYPISAKYYLNKYYNVPFQPVSRMVDVVINDQDVSMMRVGSSLLCNNIPIIPQAESLEAMKDHVDDVCAEAGIVTVIP